MITGSGQNGQRSSPVLVGEVVATAALWSPSAPVSREKSATLRKLNPPSRGSTSAPRRVAVPQVHSQRHGLPGSLGARLLHPPLLGFPIPHDALGTVDRHRAGPHLLGEVRGLPRDPLGLGDTAPRRTSRACRPVPRARYTSQTVRLTRLGQICPKRSDLAFLVTLLLLDRFPLALRCLGRVQGFSSQRHEVSLPGAQVAPSHVLGDGEPERVVPGVPPGAHLRDGEGGAHLRSRMRFSRRVSHWWSSLRYRGGLGVGSNCRGFSSAHLRT